MIFDLCCGALSAKTSILPNFLFNCLSQSETNQVHFLQAKNMDSSCARTVKPSAVFEIISSLDFF